MKYRKRNVNVEDEDVINRHLANICQDHMQKDEKHMKADEIHLGVEESYQNAIRVMLRKRKHTWSAERSEILIREHHIDVVKGT